jgi:hypothetical protein
MTRHLAWTLAALSLLAACSGDDTSSDTGAESADSDVRGSDVPGSDIPDPGAAITTSVSVEDNPLIGLAAELTIETDRPVRAEVTARSSDHAVELPRTAALSTSHTIPVVGMRADDTYQITVELFGDDDRSLGGTGMIDFTTDSLPDWFPDHQLTIDADRSSPGYTIVEATPSQPLDDTPDAVLIAYDNAGEIVWYYFNSGSLGGVEQTATGTFLMHYWPFGIREVDTLGNLVGHWRPELDSVDPDQVDYWNDALAGNPGDIDPLPVVPDWIALSGFHHENWPMPNGNILTLSTTLHDLTDEQQQAFCPDDSESFIAISDVAVEFAPDGTTLRTWDLWDAIDIDQHPGSWLCIDAGLFAGEKTRDWTHANSVVYDDERDAVIISSRHTDQIIAFEHLDELGPQSSVRWILGAGSTMPLDGDPTFHQHAVEVNADGSLIVYDNGNDRPGTSADDPANPPYSRAVIYDVDDRSADPTEWSATQRWEHRMIDDVIGAPIYTAFIGDADQLANGNVLITHGGIGEFPAPPDQPLRAVIVEVVPDGASGGEVVWRLDSDPSSSHAVYRSERIETFYVGPNWIPRS